MSAHTTDEISRRYHSSGSLTGQGGTRFRLLFLEIAFKKASRCASMFIKNALPSSLFNIVGILLITASVTASAIGFIIIKISLRHHFQPVSEWAMAVSFHVCDLLEQTINSHVLRVYFDVSFYKSISEGRSGLTMINIRCPGRPASS